MAEQLLPSQILSKDIENKKRNALDLARLAYEAGQAQVKLAEEKKKAGMVVGGQIQSQESLLFQQNEQLKAEQARSQFMQDSDYAALSTDIAQKTADETRRAMQLADEVSKMGSVSLMDSPITALQYAFELPWKQQALETSKQKLDIMNDAKAKLDSRVKGFVESSELTKRSINDATLAENTKAIAASFNAKNMEADITLRISKMNMIKEIASGEDSVVNAVLRKQQFLASEEQRAAARESKKLAQEQSSFLLSQRKENEEAEQAKINFILLGMKESGAQIKFDDPKKQRQFDMSVRSMANEQPNTVPGKLAQTYFTNGLMLKLGRKPSDGETAQERINTQNITRVSPATPAEEIVMNKYQEIFVQNSAVNKDPIAADNATRVGFQNEVAKWQNNVVSSDPLNPLGGRNTAHIAILMGQSKNPTLRTNAIQELIKTRGNEPLSPQEVLDALYRATFIDKQVSLEQAATFGNTLFSAIVAETNNHSNITKRTGEAFSEYKAAVNLPKIESLARIITEGRSIMIPGASETLSAGYDILSAINSPTKSLHVLGGVSGEGLNEWKSMLIRKRGYF